MPLNSPEKGTHRTAAVFLFRFCRPVRVLQRRILGQARVLGEGVLLVVRGLGSCLLFMPVELAGGGGLCIWMLTRMHLRVLCWSQIEDLFAFGDHVQHERRSECTECAANIIMRNLRGCKWINLVQVCLPSWQCTVLRAINNSVHRFLTKPPGTDGKLQL